MPVKQTTDTELLVETSQKPCVILKYHTDACGEPCAKLIPIYEDLSDDPAYDKIAFLRINADNNPVAKNFILNKKAPIVTIYHKGRLVESGAATDREEMVRLLHLLINTRNKIS